MHIGTHVILLLNTFNLHHLQQGKTTTCLVKDAYQVCCKKMSSNIYHSSSWSTRLEKMEMPTKNSEAEIAGV